MSRVSLITYPRLYTSLQPGSGDIIASTGDVGLELLYKLFYDRTFNNENWAYRQSVLQAAIKLFGEFSHWLDFQYADTRISGLNREFLDDTVRFITTGEREVVVENWLELVAEAGLSNQAAPSTQIAATPIARNAFAGRSTIRVLQQWCSKSGGFEDLIRTLYILFGKARPRAG